MPTQERNRAVVPAPSGPVAVISPERVAAVSMLMDSIPEADDTGEGLDGIIDRIITATDVDDLDAPWRSQGLLALENLPIEIRGLRKRPSDYPGGLPFYLVLDGAILGTGEAFTASTGAVSVVLQLAKAWTMNAFPFRCIPRVADKPSASGNYPMHLEVLRG